MRRARKGNDKMKQTEQGVNESDHYRDEHMGHDHGTTVGMHDHSSMKNIKVAFVLNLSFVLIEIIGGFLTNSLAIFSDALHDLGDTVALGMTWYLEKYSEKERNSRYTFGYRRYSLLGSVINAGLIFGGALFIISQAIPRILNPQDVNYQGMMLLAILGIIVNGTAVLRLRSGKKLSERMVSIHLLEDVMGWVAVLLVSIIMRFVYVPVLDPVLSIGISIFVIFNVLKNLKKTIAIFLQTIPEGFDLDDLKRGILEIEPIVDVHDIHLWSLDGIRHIMTFHVVIDQPLSFDDQNALKEKVKNHLSCNHIEHVTMEIEQVGEECIGKCQC